MHPDDAVLVEAARSGDREAFAAIYDRYADRLYDFCRGVLRDPDEAADAVHDAFLIAWQRLGQLRDPSSLRAWLYAVARHEATRRGKARAREAPTEVVVDVASPAPGPDDLAASAALTELIWSAAGGLEDRDRVLLDLSVRQGLDTTEIGAVIGVRTAHASVLVNRMRERVERSLGALLVARLGRKDCPDLREILAGWDGRFTVPMRKRVARHADACARCDQKRRGALSPLALLGATVAMAAPAALRDRVLDDVALVGSAGRPWPASRGGFPPPMAEPGSRRIPLATAAVLVLVIALVVTVAGPDERVRGALPPGATALPSSQAPSTVASATVPATGPASPSPSSPARQPVPSAAHLVVSAGTIDFGATASLRTLTISNDGDETVEWSAAASSPALDLTPPSGSIAAGGARQMTVVLTRGALAEGTLVASIDLTGNGGERVVQVRARVERAPVIHGVQASDEFVYVDDGPGSCGREATGVTARATDESLPLTVELHWEDQDGATGSRTMSSAGGDRYQAALGPFTAVGTVEFWVVAADPRGNTATSARQELLVAECP